MPSSLADSVSDGEPPKAASGHETGPAITRIPSVLPDAETSPGASAADLEKGIVTTTTADDAAMTTRTKTVAAAAAETASISTTATTTVPHPPPADDDDDDDDDDVAEPTSALERTSTTQYYNLPLYRKCLIVFTTAFTAVSVTFASTSLFPLTSEVSATFGTTPFVIQLTNAASVLAMGLAGFVWGPVGRLVGRKPAWIAACVVFIVTTIGSAVAPPSPNNDPSTSSNSTGLKVFIAMRILSGLEGTFFHIAGQTWLADVFEPTSRGTATGCFLMGTVFGPAFGPCIAGIMVTYAPWQSVLYLQAGMTMLGLALSLFYLPDIRRPYESVELPPRRVPSACSSSSSSLSSLAALTLGGRLTAERARAVVGAFDPSRVLAVFLYPNVVLTDVACGFMAWSQYTLLAGPRHLLNPRFGLTTPLVSGLFYIAPGVGFLLGTLVGGRYSDMTVIRWISRRGGTRLPQDRLNSGMPAFFVIVPVGSLVYAWGLEYEVGGMALPVVFAFIWAFGLLCAFASLNTYCAEVLPRRRTDVIASKYLVQYICSSVGSAAIVPMIDAMGVGPATTIGVGMTFIAGGLTWVTAKKGRDMQTWMERVRGMDSGKA